ncbi:MAG: type II secretion system protein J [Phycisphaerales bacterium]
MIAPHPRPHLPAMHHRNRAIPGTHAARAFTLIELLVALSAMSILATALGSVFVLASRALPAGQSTLTAAPAAARAVDIIAADIAYATQVSTGDARSISLTLPDRDADGQSESVAIAWSGVKGTALTRTVNGTSTETLLTNVRDLTLGYELATTTSGSAGGGTASEQTILSITGSSTFTPITDPESIGQSFRPVLPAEATSWSITRIGIRLDDYGVVTGQVALQIRAVDTAGLPTSTILWQTTINETSVTSGALVNYTVSNVTGLVPGTTYCIMVAHRDGSFAAAAPVISAASPVGGALITGEDDKSDWARTTSKSMECTVYGQVTSPVTTIATASNLERVLISLRAESDNAPTVRASALPLNRPGVQP